MKYVGIYYVVDTIGTLPQVFSSEKKAREFLDQQIVEFEKKGCIVVNYSDNLWSVEDLENMQTDHIGLMHCLVN